MLIELFNDRLRNISGHNELFSFIPSSNFWQITGGIRRLVHWATINPTVGVYRIDKGSGIFSPMILVRTYTMSPIVNVKYLIYDNCYKNFEMSFHRRFVSFFFNFIPFFDSNFELYRLHNKA